MRVWALVLACAWTVAGCREYQTEPLPLDVTIKADRAETVPGDSVTFEISGRGGQLLGFLVVWGDSTSVEQPTYNARTATTKIRHAYGRAGVYAVIVTVYDVSAGARTAGLSITVR